MLVFLILPWVLGKIAERHWAWGAGVRRGVGGGPGWSWAWWPSRSGRRPRRRGPPRATRAACDAPSSPPLSPRFANCRRAYRPAIAVLVARAIAHGRHSSNARARPQSTAVVQPSAEPQRRLIWKKQRRIFCESRFRQSYRKLDPSVWSLEWSWMKPRCYECSDRPDFFLILNFLNWFYNLNLNKI